MRRGALAFAAALMHACSGEDRSPVDNEPPEPSLSYECRTLCCAEKGARCDGGDGVCEECNARCEHACASARPLRRCLFDTARIRFVCAPDGTVVPETDACDEQFNAYQAATRACGQPSAAVGGK